MTRHLRKLPAPLRRVLVGVIGALVTALGLVLLFLPGPGLLVIPAGLAILAVEFEAPRRWKHQLAHWWHTQRNTRGRS